MHAWLLTLLALGAGISVATQQVLNGNLRTALNSPAWAGFVSYLGGTLENAPPPDTSQSVVLAGGVA